MAAKIPKKKNNTSERFSNPQNNQLKQNILNKSLRKTYNSNKTKILPSNQSHNPKKRRKKDFSANFVKTQISFKDIGGMDDILQEITEFVIYPLKHPEIYKTLGVNPPKGVLFHGPSGGGKTLAAMAAATEAQTRLLRLSAAELVSGVSGESEENLRDAFSTAKAETPCVLLIDDIDVLCPGGDTKGKSMERRVTAQLVSCLDDLSLGNCPVMVICTTASAEGVEKSLRRGGRLDREIEFKPPDRKGRLSILETLTKDTKLDKSVDFGRIASLASGFVGADLALLHREAAKLSLRRIFGLLYAHNNTEKDGGKDIIDLSCKKTVAGGIIEIREEKFFRSDPPKEAVGLSPQQKPKYDIKIALDEIKIRMEDYLQSLKQVKPSLKREGFTETPATSWDDVGGLKQLHRELKMAVVFPVLYPDLFKAQGLGISSGILLYGPPGCGKTLVARAMANEANASFIAVKGPELLNSLVGETERRIRALFSRAYTCAPCIIFFDEIEALVPKRMERQDSSEVSLRVVTQLLAEIDGLEERTGLFIIAASNRPDVIDKALLRPGRIGRSIYVPLPDKKSRREIFAKHLIKIPCDCRSEMAEFLSDRTNGFSGADCSDVVQKASRFALSGFLEGFDANLGLDGIQQKMATKSVTSCAGVCVTQEHFTKSLDVSSRSVSVKDEEFYKHMASDLMN